MSFNITVEGGSSVRLPTAGKYCDRDIVITAEGGTEDLNDVLTEQEALITELQETLRGKATGSGISPDDIASAGITGDIVINHSSIAAYAFANNTGITSLTAPNVTSVGTYAFYQTGLTGALDLTPCKTIGAYAFCNCYGITSLSIPNVTSVGTNAFQYCKNIERLDVPNLTTMGTYAFSGNASNQMAFKSINLPKCKAIPNSAFTYCPYVTELVLPECTSVGNSSLTNCANLQYVDLPKCTSIVNYGLRNNGKLETLILRSEKMCTLSNSALNSTKIWNGTGYVYMPRALIASYQTATNWKTIYGKNANAFRALEDYTVDGTLTGELDPNKI